MIFLVFFVHCIVVGYCGRRNPSKANSGYDYHKIWNGLFNADVHHGSYTTVGQEGSDVDTLLKVIHANQFPAKRDCSKRRLLILDMSDGSFEGIGSVLREVVFALSVAVHSNRTLVWGLQISMLFKYSHELLVSEVGEDVHLNVSTGNLTMPLTCKADNVGDYISGPYRCFFQSISSCSLDDVTEKEWVDYGNARQFDDHMRLMRHDLRRAVSLFQPPLGLFQYLSTVTLKDSQESVFQRASSNQYHLWTAAVVSYVFRLQKSVAQSFIERNMHLFPFRSSLLAGFGLDRSQSSELAAKTVWGIHIRHGDLKASKETYKYKKVYQFEDYFEAAKSHSHHLQQTPDYVYIATDSVDISELYETFAEESKEGWYEDKIPTMIVLDNSNRFRTPFGSHAVAAGGGCVLEAGLAKKGMKRCTVVPDAIKSYEVRDVPRSQMMLRVITEAIEDIFLLSECDVIFGSGSSYYSSISSVLVWAHSNHAINFVDRVVFLDQIEVDAGLIPTAFLPVEHRIDTAPQQNPDTNALLSSGKKKWEYETLSYITGLKDSPFHNDAGAVNYWSSKYHMHMENKLPRMPDKLFYLESRMWLAIGPYTPVMRGQCPPAFSPSDPSDYDDLDESAQEQILQELMNYATNVANLGVDHYSAEHPNQALKCWFNVAEAIQRYPQLQQHPRIRDAYEIVTGNALTFKSQIYLSSVSYRGRLRTLIDQLLTREAIDKLTGEYYERIGNAYPNPDEFLNPLATSSAATGGAGAGAGAGDQPGYRTIHLSSLVPSEAGADPNSDDLPYQQEFDYFFRMHQRQTEAKNQFKGVDDLVEETAELDYRLQQLKEYKIRVQQIEAAAISVNGLV